MVVHSPAYCVAGEGRRDKGSGEDTGAHGGHAGHANVGAGGGKLFRGD